jgi:hypothetical protein
VKSGEHIGNNLPKARNRINLLINLIGYMNNNVNHVCHPKKSSFFVQMKCYERDCLSSNNNDYVSRWFNLLYNYMESINKLNNNECEKFNEDLDDKECPPNYVDKVVVEQDGTERVFHDGAGKKKFSNTLLEKSVLYYFYSKSKFRPSVSTINIKPGPVDT